MLDYADERCSLNRGFGAGENALHLRIDSFGSWRDFRATVSGPAVPRSRKPMADFKFRLTPDAEDRETEALTGMLGSSPAAAFGLSFAPFEPRERGMSDRQLRILAAVPKPIERDFEAQVSTIEMEFENGKRVELALSDMPQALEAMRACVDDLQKSWGLDPAVQRGLSRKPVVQPLTVRSVQRRYPAEMALAGTNAYVPVRVMVDARGEATACVVQADSVQEAFREAVCAGLAGGFEPALDSAGTPVASVYQTSVIYLVN